ncbi:uncharacterized protein LOC120447521 isoform X1 [Drosophila santomea]|uniref:uncharacterized protein LOC120447521 isoform X1 n=1 Tax=Drosophila santomea TaxID=129105 RepID=UPI001954EF5C|nr:uncharacterized protein LOC120447521 isoform X1 [Drosophila santomea]
MAIHEQIDNLNIWWFPRDFCQSRFGEYQQSGTNSCTLISLILADKVAKAERFYHRVSDLPLRGWELFGNAINDGNNVYHNVITTNTPHSRNLNLNIPDAIAAIRSQHKMNFRLEEWFYTHMEADPSSPMYNRNVAVQLSRIFQITLQVFQQASVRDNMPTNLFAAIIADSRTVMVTFDFRASIVALFDSHQHGRDAGAVFAQCTLQSMDDLLFWFISMLHNVYSSRPSLFEISFLSSQPGVAKRIPPAIKKIAGDLKKPVKMNIPRPSH